MYDLEHEPLAGAAGRWDIYGPIHKGLRLGHAKLLQRLGSADWTADQAGLLAELREHLKLAAKHLAHEEAHIHTALEARDAGATATLDEEHEAHRARFAALQARLDGLAVAAAPDRPTLGRALYLAFGDLVAEDLAHMHGEETVVWPKLCAAFTDAELQAIEMTIVGSLSPEETMGFMRLMIPAINRTERAGMLGGMKAGAPPEAYRWVLDGAARPTLSAEDWADLEARGLA